MTTIRRLFTLAVTSAATVLAAFAAGPVAFASYTPPEPVGNAPVATVSHLSTVTSSGGMLGWQIALIAIGAALIATAVTAGVDRFAFYRRLAHQAV